MEGTESQAVALRKRVYQILPYRVSLDEEAGPRPCADISVASKSHICAYKRSTNMIPLCDYNSDLMLNKTSWVRDHADIFTAIKLVSSSSRKNDFAPMRLLLRPPRRCSRSPPIARRDQAFAVFHERYFQDEPTHNFLYLNKNTSGCLNDKIEVLGLDRANLVDISQKVEYAMMLLHLRAASLKLLGTHAVYFNTEPNTYATPESFLMLVRLLVFRGKQVLASMADDVTSLTLRQTFGAVLLSNFQKQRVELLPSELPQSHLINLILSHCSGTLEAAAFLNSYACEKWTCRDLKLNDRDAVSKLNIERVYWLLTLVLSTQMKEGFSGKLFMGLCNCLRSINVPLKALICEILTGILRLWLKLFNNNNMVLKLLSARCNRISLTLPPQRYLFKLFCVSSFIPHMRLGLEKRVARERRQCRLSFSIYVQAMVALLISFAYLEESFVTWYGNGSAQEPCLVDISPPKLGLAMPSALHLNWGSYGRHVMCVYELKLSDSIFGTKPHPESFRTIYRGSRTNTIIGCLMPSRLYHFNLSILSVSGLPLSVGSRIVSYETTAGTPCVFDRSKSGPNILTSRDGLTAMYSGNESWSTIMGSTPLLVGQNQWEILIESSQTSYIFIGVAHQSADLRTFLGGDEYSWGCIGDRALYHKRTKIKMFGERFGQGDVIQVLLDSNIGTLSLFKNRVELGLAFKGLYGELYPAVAFYNKGQRVRMVLTPSTCPGVGVTISQSPSAYGIDALCRFSQLLLSISTQVCPQAAIRYRTFKIHQYWHSGLVKRHATAFGYHLQLDTSDAACLQFGVLAGQKINTPRGPASVVGVNSGLIWCQHEPDCDLFFISHSDIPTPSQNVQHPELKTDQCFYEYDAIITTPRMFSVVIDTVLVNAMDATSLLKCTSPWNLTPHEVHEAFRSKYTEIEPETLPPEGHTQSRAIYRSSFLFAFNEDVLCAFPFITHIEMYDRKSNLWPIKTWGLELPETVKSSLFATRQSSQLAVNLYSTRGYIFACTKEATFNQFIRRTTSQAKKADDDYDYPDDLPLVLINRRKAATVNLTSVPEVLTLLFFPMSYVLNLKRLKLTAPDVIVSFWSII